MGKLTCLYQDIYLRKAVTDVTLLNANDLRRYTPRYKSSVTRYMVEFQLLRALQPVNAI